MTTITVAITDERLTRLKEIAARLSVTPEDPVRVSTEELLPRLEDSFREAVGYVLQKNAEPYRRLG